MTNSIRSAGFSLILLGALAGCQTTGGREAAGDDYAGRGFSDGLRGHEWRCGQGGRDCGSAAEDQAAYQEGWVRGWTQRCERATALPALKACEQTLGGDWTSEAIAKQRRSSRSSNSSASGGGRGGR